ncbi:hypothetical protein [Amphritea sp. HPY]|uniref:hypothetical protein n=1 Tax=Amphritea sp. HPY TaxID=3421652 RepID=UPI003D7ED791
MHKQFPRKKKTSKLEKHKYEVLADINDRGMTIREAADKWQIAPSSLSLLRQRWMGRNYYPLTRVGS